MTDSHCGRSPFGHDKSIEIRKYSTLPDGERPVLFYAGDGVSDLSAAKETDLLFAKAGRGRRLSESGDTAELYLMLIALADLVTYCEKEGVPFATFESFAEILTTVKDIVAGNLSVKDAAKGRR